MTGSAGMLQRQCRGVSEVLVRREKGHGSSKSTSLLPASWLSITSNLPEPHNPLIPPQSPRGSCVKPGGIWTEGTTSQDSAPSPCPAQSQAGTCQGAQCLGISLIPPLLLPTSPAGNATSQTPPDTAPKGTIPSLGLASCPDPVQSPGRR